MLIKMICIRLQACRAAPWSCSPVPSRSPCCWSARPSPCSAASLTSITSTFRLSKVGSRRSTSVGLYVQIQSIHGGRVLFYLLLLRASHRDAADEPDRRQFSPDVPDVSCPPVEDLITAPDVPLAHNGHRTCKIAVAGYKMLCFYISADLHSLAFFFFFQIRTFTRLEKALQAEKDVSKYVFVSNLLRCYWSFHPENLMIFFLSIRLAKVVRGALDRNGPVNFSQADLDMYLSACKFLDTSLAFPPERMPLFQM